MKFKTLTLEETSEWIDLLEETIELCVQVSERWVKRRTEIEELFVQNYQSKWYWNLWMNGAEIDSLHFSQSGNIQHLDCLSWQHLSKLPKLTEPEILGMLTHYLWEGVSYDANVYMYKNITSNRSRKVRYTTLLEMWKSFAENPFTVDEDDIARYMDIRQRNTNIKKIIKDWDNEA